MVENKPIFVFNFFRHGIRSPLDIINQVDLLGYDWHEQPGVLTQKGFEQQEELGKKLNSLYGHLINEDIITFSTDYSRTIGSLKAQLKGILNDEGLEKAVYDKTVIIPHLDTKYKVYKNKNIKEIFKAKPYDEFNKFIANFKENSAKHLINWLPAGYDKDSIEVLKRVCNNFVCLVGEARNLQKFEDVETILEESKLMYLNNMQYNNCVKSTVVQDLNNTEIFKIIFNSYEKSLESKSKYATFSGHDNTIVLLMLSLNRFFGTKISYADFASCLTFEVYESEKVRVLLNFEEMVEVDYKELKDKAETTFVTYEEVVEQFKV